MGDVETVPDPLLVTVVVALPVPPLPSEAEAQAVPLVCALPVPQPLTLADDVCDAAMLPLHALLGDAVLLVHVEAVPSFPPMLALTDALRHTVPAELPVPKSGSGEAVAHAVPPPVALEEPDTEEDIVTRADAVPRELADAAGVPIKEAVPPPLSEALLVKESNPLPEVVILPPKATLPV